MYIESHSPAQRQPSIDPIPYHHPQLGMTELGFGFLPAFQDPFSGETHLSTYADGRIAAVHLLDGVPAHWVDEWDEQGRPISLQDGIVAGFMRHHRFCTYRELTAHRHDA